VRHRLLQAICNFATEPLDLFVQPYSYLPGRNRQQREPHGKVALDITLPIWQICQMTTLDTYFAQTRGNASKLAHRIGRAVSSIARPLNGECNASTTLALDIGRGTGGCVTASEFLSICLAAKKMREAQFISCPLPQPETPHEQTGTHNKGPGCKETSIRKVIDENGLAHFEIGASPCRPTPPKPARSPDAAEEEQRTAALRLFVRVWAQFVLIAIDVPSSAFFRQSSIEALKKRSGGR